MRFSITKSTLVYPFLASVIAAIFRLVPVALAWPYAVGYDTNTAYIVQMIHPIPSLYFVFSQQGLHALILSTFYHIFPTTFVILDAFAVIVQAVLALEIYAYARKVAGLDPNYSFLVAIIFTFNLLTMRLLWDQYRMDLGLIFSLATFLALSSKSASKRWLGFPLIFLVVISNAEPTVFVVLTLLVFALAKSKMNLKSLILGQEFLTAIFGLVLFGIQLDLLRNAGPESYVPLYQLSSVGGTNQSLNGLIFLIYSAWPLLIFFPFALRRKLEYHTIWFFVILAFAVGIPLTGLGITHEPTDWLYWMMSFPLAITFGQAILRRNGRAKLAENKKGAAKLGEPPNHLFNRLIAILTAFLIITSSAYAVSSPLLPSPYSLIAIGYASDMPTGYLQSTVPIPQEGELMSLLNSTLISLPKNATLYLGEQFYGLSLILPNPNSINLIFVGRISSDANLSDLSGANGGYTIWWTTPVGWYGVDKIPQGFIAISQQGPFSLYKIE